MDAVTLALIKSLSGGNGGGSSDYFIVTVTGQGASLMTDKTSDEILSAIDAGKTVICKAGPQYYTLQEYGAGSVSFCAFRSGVDGENEDLLKITITGSSVYGSIYGLLPNISTLGSFYGVDANGIRTLIGGLDVITKNGSVLSKTFQEIASSVLGNKIIIIVEGSVYYNFVYANSSYIVFSAGAGLVEDEYGHITHTASQYLFVHADNSVTIENTTFLPKVSNLNAGESLYVDDSGMIQTGFVRPLKIPYNINIQVIPVDFDGTSLSTTITPDDVYNGFTVDGVEMPRINDADMTVLGVGAPGATLAQRSKVPLPIFYANSVGANFQSITAPLDSFGFTGEIGFAMLSASSSNTPYQVNLTHWTASVI